MCFTGDCPAEDYTGECTALNRLDPLPCEAMEIFNDEGALPIWAGEGEV